MNLKTKSKRTNKSSPTPVEKKTRLSNKNKKHNLSKPINAAEISKETAERKCFNKRINSIQPCFENQTIDTIYEDTTSNDNKSEFSSDLESDLSISSNCCLICGDDTELIEHKVCFWHAITEKNLSNMPLYQNECDYALIKYRNIDSYLNRVHEKKKYVLNQLLY